MADQKISADPNLASPAAGDLIPIVDIDVADSLKNKTITWSQITDLGGGLSWSYYTTSQTVAANTGSVFNGSSLTATLPSGTLTVGDRIEIANRNSTTLTVADNGNTLEFDGGSYASDVTLERGERISLIAVTTAIWLII